MNRLIAQRGRREYPKKSPKRFNAIAGGDERRYIDSQPKLKGTFRSGCAIRRSSLISSDSKQRWTGTLGGQREGGLAMVRNSIQGFLIALVSAAPYCAGQAAPSTAQPTANIYAKADLVVVDVVVSDDKNKPISHLNPADFKILEDGKPQTLKVFEEHAAVQQTPLPPAPRFDPGTFTNYSPVPPNSALNILLFDKLNTPLNAQSVVRDQVLQYLKEAHPDTRIAIFSLTTELKLLQGFTSDPELLRALIAGKKGSQGASPLMNDAEEGDQPGADDQMMDTETDALGNDPDATTILANLQQFEAEQQSFQIQLRQRYTLDALNQLARYMSNLPGRKNLIWFSGSFPISIMPDADLQNPFAVVASAEDEFRETVDLLSRSQVSVYPIDARGLMVAPMLDASQNGSTMNSKPNGFAKANTKWFQNTADEQGTMQSMAEATGGKSFTNTNGLKEAVGKAIEAGSNYYTIAYTPTDRDWKGNFRKIQIRVDRPGVSLAYRRGYFADDPNKPTQRSGGENPISNATQYSAIRASMVHGAPDPTDLIFVASVRPSTGATEASTAPGNQAGKKLSGPFQRYKVTFIANPKVVNCAAGADGLHQCALAFLTFVYDDDGVLVNMQTNELTFNIPPEKYAEAMNHNFVYRQEISVPVKGEYYLRIGMRDGNTDKVGALEVPVSAVAKLAPAAAPPATAAPTASPESK
jgi:VWFA-related protein